MINPGNIAFGMIPSEDDESRKQRDLERTTRENAAARSLGRSQIGDGGEIQVDGTMEINGALNVSGTASVSGSLVVSGTLSVPAGSMDTAGSISAGVDVAAGEDVTAVRDVMAGRNVAAVGAVSGATVAATGDLTVGGIATIGNVLTADAGISSLDVRNRLLSSGYVSVYADSTGRLGYVPSSLRVKTITGAYTASLEDWLAVAPQVFYYNEDENHTPRVGFIAEWVNVHFPEFVVHDNVEDEEGTRPAGLHYEFMIAGMQSAFRQFVAESRAETASLRARVTALGG